MKDPKQKCDCYEQVEKEKKKLPERDGVTEM